MPDFLLLTKAGLAAAVTAGVVFLLLGLPWRSPNPTRLGLGWTWGVGLGFYAGCAVLGTWTSWPPTNDRERLMALVVPAALLVESVAVCAFLPRWLIWLPRVFLAAAVMPILLYGKGYYEDSAVRRNAGMAPADGHQSRAGPGRSVVIGLAFVGSIASTGIGKSGGGDSFSDSAFSRRRRHVSRLSKWRTIRNSFGGSPGGDDGRFASARSTTDQAMFFGNRVDWSL